jgi:hypothetical protein
MRRALLLLASLSLLVAAACGDTGDSKLSNGQDLPPGTQVDGGGADGSVVQPDTDSGSAGSDDSGTTQDMDSGQNTTDAGNQPKDSGFAVDSGHD